MEIRYRLQLSDLESVRRHMATRSRGTARNRLQGSRKGAILAVSLVIAWRLYATGDGIGYQFMWIVPGALYFVSEIWMAFWSRSPFARRWLERFVGEYRLAGVSGGVYWGTADGDATFYPWHEIRGFEQTDDLLYLYPGLDSAIAIPRAALPDEGAKFIEQVREWWAAHPGNAGKMLPDFPLSGVPFAALLSNLQQGARIAFFTNFDIGRIHATFGLLLQLQLLSLLCLAGVDYLDAYPAPEFNVYGLSTFASLTLLMLGGGACIGGRVRQRADLLRLFVVLSATELVVNLLYFSSWLAVSHWLPDSHWLLWGVFWAGASWTLAAVFRIVRRMYRQPAPSALLLVAIYGFFTLTLAGLLPSQRLYYNAAAGNESAANEALNSLDVEDLYYRQPALVEHEVAGLKSERRGTTDLYFIGFAGQAEERVFFNEVSYARNLLDRRFHTFGRSVVLVNNTDTVHSVPLANRHNLEAVLQGVAQRMDLAEDVLFLFLSSHGAKDRKLSVSFWPFRLNDLSAEELKEMLDRVGIRNRVIVVSACYSGGFLDVLKDDNTLVLTASSRDHVSYGCGDFTQYTYFGESFFVKSLTGGDSFVSAFEQARRLIEEREAAEGLDASAPQIHEGAKITRILQTLEVEPAAPNRLVGPEWIEAARSFDERVRLARRFEQDAAAREYTKKHLFPAVNELMSDPLTECLEQAGAARENFTLVADILRDGGVGGIEFEPATDIALCFGESFGTLRLPPLPQQFDRLPVLFDMLLDG